MTFIFENALLLEPWWFFLNFFKLHLIFYNLSSQIKLATLSNQNTLLLYLSIESSYSVRQLVQALW